MIGWPVYWQNWYFSQGTGHIANGSHWDHFNSSFVGKHDIIIFITNFPSFAKYFLPSTRTKSCPILVQTGKYWLYTTLFMRSIRKCHFQITSYLTELYLFCWQFINEDTFWCFSKEACILSLCSPGHISIVARHQLNRLCYYKQCFEFQALFRKKF